MLLILSDESDSSTNSVINWLNYFAVSYKRINDTSRLSLENLQLGNKDISWELILQEAFSTKTTKIKISEITSFWYRRGELTFDKYTFIGDNPKHKPIIDQYRKHLFKQQSDIVNLLYNTLKKRKHIGCFYDNYTVKLYNLMVAMECGLNVPPSIVVTKKDDLLQFIKKYNQCITKGIQHNGFFIPGELDVSCNTKVIKATDLEQVPSVFAPSLVQQYIDKSFELRIFYLDEKCYSAAIFSQQDEKTKIDFRNYNEERPNRIVPYLLPCDIENKLTRFMKSINMKSGSIDLIVSQNMEYVFLEINPIGQFEWISSACNYQVEKLFATYFKNALIQ